MTTAPVVFLSFNRPEHTRQMLDRIRDARPRQLLLLADGPRRDRVDDEARCSAVRDELDRIDWPCEVERRYNSVNRGMDATTVLGLDWAFDHVEEAIFLEDDTLPHPDFFRFCTELLDRYRSNPDVWHIAGHAPAGTTPPPDGSSYRFTAFGSTWGWATWRRAWRAHRARFPRDEDGRLVPTERSISFDGRRLLTPGGRRYFSDVAKGTRGHAFAWDSFWALTVVAADAVAATSATNLIENVGFGEEATNTRNPLEQPGLQPVAWPLRHPRSLAIDPEFQRFAERIVTRHSGRAARYLAHRLTNPHLRRAVRNAATVWRHAATRRQLAR